MQATQEYLESHNIQKVVEDVINSVVQAKPSDPFGYMVRIYARLSLSIYLAKEFCNDLVHHIPPPLTNAGQRAEEKLIFRHC